MDWRNEMEALLIDFENYLKDSDRWDDETAEKFNQIKEALERMKPMKVTYDDSSLGKPGVPEFWIAYCPECKQPIDFDDTPFEFCRRCGQALDWEETK